MMHSSDMDPPVTQKQLLKMQLDNQTEMFNQMGRLEQLVNDRSDDVKADVAETAERVARIEGRLIEKEQDRKDKDSKSNLRWWKIATLMSFITSAAAIVLEHVKF